MLSALICYLFGHVTARTIIGWNSPEPGVVDVHYHYGCCRCRYTFEAVSRSGGVPATVPHG